MLSIFCMIIVLVLDQAAGDPFFSDLCIADSNGYMFRIWKHS